MLIREVADNKPLQAPAAKWQSHPKVGVLRPASTVTSLMWTARSILPACQDSKTESKVKCPAFCSHCMPLHPTPALAATQGWWYFWTSRGSRCPSFWFHRGNSRHYQLARQITQILKWLSTGILWLSWAWGLVWGHPCISVGLGFSLKVHCLEGVPDSEIQVGSVPDKGETKALKDCSKM